MRSSFKLSDEGVVRVIRGWGDPEANYSGRSVGRGVSPASGSGVGMWRGLTSVSPGPPA